MRALEFAAFGSHAAVVQVLLGSYPKMSEASKALALRAAASQGHSEVVQLLLAAGAFLRRGVDEHAVRRAVHQELMAFEAEAAADEIERRAPRGRR